MNKDEKEFFAALTTMERYLAKRASTDTEASNFVGSAERVMRMYHEMSLTPDDIAKQVTKILNVAFPVDEHAESGMVVQGPITVNSMCPHHWLPVRYAGYLAYIPKKGGKVLGLSKLARIPEMLAKRFVLQEQLAKDIADVFYKPAILSLLKNQEIAFESEGSIVTLIGTHSCMSCRGVGQDARTLTTERRGVFQDSEMEGRFYQASGALRVERPFGG